MKKTVLFICFILLLSLTACNIQGGTMYKKSDTSAFAFDINQCEATAYSLLDFHNYFGTVSPNEAIMYNLIDDISFLQFERIKEYFNVSTVKETSYHSLYSIFTVSEGGYFVIFWAYNTTSSLLIEDDRSKESLRAIVTVYINKKSDYHNIKNLQKKLHTAEDVFEFCSATELCFTSSSDIVSFSLLSDEDLLVVNYSCSGTPRSRIDLVVKSIKVVDIHTESYASYLSSINWTNIIDSNS